MSVEYQRANLGALAGGFLVPAAVFYATCAWVSAHPTFSELFPTHLRATGVGASVAVGRIRAILGQTVFGELALAFGFWSACSLLPEPSHGSAGSRHAA